MSKKNNQPVCNYPDLLIEKLWIESFRYCVGRATYAVQEFCDYYRSYYDTIPKRAKFVIGRDLDREIEKNVSLGHDCDHQDWLDLAKFIREQETGK